MRTLRAWVVRFVALFRADRFEHDLQDELDSHLQMHTADNIRAGMPPAAARRAAVLRMGSMEGTKEQQRDRAGVPQLQNLARDVRYACRVLRRNSAFSVVTVLTLALGIGANTAIFTLVNAVLLRPLPYLEADRLAMISATDGARGDRDAPISYPDFEAWGSGARAFEHVAALTTGAVTLGGGDQPELVPAVQTTTGFFRVLQVNPILGRTFDDGDAGLGAQPVAVLSDSAWRRQFGGRPDILGQVIAVNGRPHVVVGVVPASMHILPTESEQVYTLLPPETGRAHVYLRMLARLRPGVTFEEAQSELDVLSRRIASAFPETNATTGAAIVPLVSAVGAPVRDGLLILLALVGVVLLIAGSNVANLLLARNASRQPELRLRMSLGASRGRIVQQLLAESFVLAAAGGAAGLALAEILTGGLVAMLDGGVPVPRMERVRVDTAVVVFAFGVSIVTGLLFGVIPAILGAPGKLQAAARDAGRAMTSRGGRRTRAGLVVLETALALTLLAASAMLVRTFIELRATPSGFVPDDVLAVGGRLPRGLTPGAQREAFFEQVRARVEALPGVRSAGVVTNLPMGGSGDSLQFRVLGSTVAKPASARFNMAGPGYFRTMRIPVSRGREFSASDTADAPAVVVINEAAARRFWPGMDPIGRRMALTGRPTEFTVVGVAGDVRQSDLSTAPRPEIFLSSLQTGPDWSGFALVVQTSSGDPIALAPDVRGVLRAADTRVAIAKVGTMHDVLAGRLAQPRVYTVLLGAFAALALLLATVGLYGVISYSVAQRTRELGIRLALGSSPRGLVSGVLREGAVLMAAGTLLGLAGGYAAMRGVANLLPGARPSDPITLAAAALLLVAVGGAASYVPARRAAHVDPLTALRTG